MENWASADWEKFEKLVEVYHIFRSEGQYEVSRDIKMKGLKSGQDNQIDVLLTFSGIYSFEIIVSCKFEKVPVGIDHAREWGSIVQDVNAARGIIVSKEGFTEPAINFAKNFQEARLELWQIRPIDETYFDGAIQKITINCTMWEPFVPGNTVKFSVQTTDPSIPKQRIPFQLSRENRDGLFLRDQQENLRENLWDEFVKFYYQNASLDQHVYKFDFTPREPRFIVTQGRKLIFKSFYCEIHDRAHNFPIHFDALDYFKHEYKNCINGKTQLVPLELIKMADM